jgi:hypothetical protein
MSETGACAARARMRLFGIQGIAEGGDPPVQSDERAGRRLGNLTADGADGVG